MRNRSSFLFVGFWILGSGYWMLETGRGDFFFFLQSASVISVIFHLFHFLNSVIFTGFWILEAGFWTFEGGGNK